MRWEIHLIHQGTGAQTLIYLKTPISVGIPSQPGQSVAFQFVLNQTFHADSDLLIERLNQDGGLEVDGKPVMTTAPIRNGSVLAVNGEAYNIDIRTVSATAKPSLRANWLSVTGSYRDHNEDAIGIDQRGDISFFVLCDGVGGAEAGEIVSEHAVQKMLAAFHRAEGGNSHALMESTLRAINDDVRAASAAASQKQGRLVQMGSTLVAVVIEGWNAYICHVGDSRLYLWRAGMLQQVTTDHATFMDETHAQAAGKRNVLMRGIGKTDGIQPDLLTLQLQPGDRLLLGSDGMSDKIEQGELAHLLTTMPIETLPDYLARTADSRMCKDNISIILVEVYGEPTAPLAVPPQERAFVGYNPAYSGQMGVASAKPKGGARRLVPLLLAGILLLAVGVGAVVASQSASAAALVASQTETQAAASPTPSATDTPSLTPTPSDTSTPTWTPSRTPSPTYTPPPPTATLRTGG